jgi:hypothetical protein
VMTVFMIVLMTELVSVLKTVLMTGVDGWLMDVCLC